MITFGSRFWLGTLSKISLILMLFLRSYCFNELWFLSRDIVLLSRSLTFFVRSWLSSWRFLTITSFKFCISFSKPWNLEVKSFSKLKMRLAVSDITEASDASKFSSHDTFSSIVERDYFLCCKHVTSWLISC